MYTTKILKKLIMVSFFTLIINIANADIKSGLVADFPFSGGAVDGSGNNYRATVFGATLTEDRFGNENSAYEFSFDKFIQTNVGGEKINNAMSISFWMKTPEDAYSKVWKCRDLRAYLISTYAAEGQGHNFNYCGQDNNADSLNFNMKLWDNAWHHLVINYNSSSISIYVDGNIFSTKNVDTFSFQGDYFKFGKHRPTTTAKYRGVLDDIKIYNRILSSSDVLELFEATVGLQPVMLDIDGNGNIKPLSDGLLLLRYQFGFRGETLINSAVDLNSCKRCTSIEIEAYLSKLSVLPSFN